MSKGCRMEADTPLKVLCIALWRSSSGQPELMLIYVLLITAPTYHSYTRKISESDGSFNGLDE